MEEMMEAVQPGNDLYVAKSSESNGAIITDRPPSGGGVNNTGHKVMTALAAQVSS